MQNMHVQRYRGVLHRRGITSRSVCSVHACAETTKVSFNNQLALIDRIASHLVKHTANIVSSLRSSGMVMVVMHRRPSHAHVRWPRWGRQSRRIGHPRSAWATWTGHVVTVYRACSLAGGHLRHSAYASTPQSRVLVTVAPAVDRALDETALSAQAWIQLCQRPADCVALGLVVQTVAFVLVLGTAGAWVHAILSLEILRQLVHVDRLDVAADRIFHLHTVARVFECDPLYTALVLPNDQWGSCWDGTRCSVRVHVRTSRWARMHRGRTAGRSLRRTLRWTQA